MILKRGIPSLFVLAAVFLLSACTKTQLPANDATPPEWIWTIKHSKGGQEKFDTTQCNPKCPVVKQLAGETLNITFYAKDLEGIHEIILGSGNDSGFVGNYVCVEDGSTHGEGLTWSPKEEKKTLPSGSVVETSASLNRTVGLNLGATCTAGSTFVEGNLTLVGTAENFFQGKVTSKLNICSPECKILSPP